MTDIASVPLTGDAELNLVAEQLWPGLDGSDHRVTGTMAPDPDWVDVERHRVLGLRGRVMLIVPHAPGAASRAVQAYAALRPWKQRAARVALGAALRMPAPRQRTIALQRRAGSPAEPQGTVLEHLRDAFGADIDILLPVRRGANRKALVQIVDPRGATLGYAKVARDEVSARGIETEVEVLARLDGSAGSVRVPRLLLSGHCRSLPFLVTEPLPGAIRGVGRGVSVTPSPLEFGALSPVARRGAPDQSGHIQRMRQRIDALHGGPPSLVQALRSLHALLAASERELPIVAFSHGDLAFWNVGREHDGVLWVWDFENVEVDTLAGLDAVHWHASRRRVTDGPAGVADRDGILSDARSTLRAFGISAIDEVTVYRAYIADIVLRTAQIGEADGWTQAWTSPRELERLVRTAIWP